MGFISYMFNVLKQTVPVEIDGTLVLFWSAYVVNEYILIDTLCFVNTW